MDLKQSTVAVTGATGFIGRYIVRALLERGTHVVAVVRNPDKVPRMAELGVELRKADLADQSALVRGFTGCDAVIANAAVISLARESRETMIAHNLEGTLNVFEAIAHAGVKRAIQTSSATVYRPQRDHLYVEDDPMRTAEDPPAAFSNYAVSKACAEQAAWEMAHRHGIALSTVRPHSVHGAFDNGSFTLWFKRLMKLPITPYPTHMRLPSVYAGDIADAMCRMLEAPASAGRAYNITGDPDLHSYWDFIGAYRDAGGKTPAVVLPVPLPMRRRYSIERAHTDLGWRNRPLAEGFRDMVAVERGEVATHP
jgi:nucleoside-diphosphate-sugar epimerase